jgi:hypothetical protein
MSAPADHRWPGRGLGLPETGPRSLARAGRRVGALAIDWAISLGIGYAAFWNADVGLRGWIDLAVWVVLTILFELFFLGSPGHLLLRMRVVPVRGGRLAPWRPVVRTLLLALVVPALIGDEEGRALHDRAAGTILVRV